jgi:hypothetical protein
VQVEIGPVGGDSVLAWVDYARVVLDHYTGRIGSPLPDEDLDRLRGLVDGWAAAARPGEPFRWTDRRDIEEVEFLIRGLLSLGNAVERDHPTGGVPLRPAAADEFHLTLVRQMLTQLAAEGPSCAQFAEALREEWGVAAQD